MNVETQATTTQVGESLGDIYTAARATPTLVGRKETLQAIQAAIQHRNHSCVVYITGSGGVGKTRIIKHMLELAAAAKDSTLLVASELIDLYHTRNRSVGGLIESVLAVLKPVADAIRTQAADIQVDEQLISLARAEQEGLSTAELVGRRQDLSQSLLDFINQFTAHQRLVIALDTAEQLFVARDIAQERLGLQEERPPVLDWLLNDFLPELKNTVVLLAGRPKPLNLTAELTRITTGSGRHFHPIELSGLTETETLLYFEAVAEGAAHSKRDADKNAAKFIAGLSEDERRTIFHCLRDDGQEATIRPILLALAIDHVVVSGSPLAAFSRSLAEATALSEAERRSIEGQLSSSLVRSLQENRRPADELIITLGWLRKGADAELLAQVMERSLPEVATAIEEIKNLSIVKIRPKDERIFLHDEMYELLNRHIQHYHLPTERQRVFALIAHYYSEIIAQARTEIDRLYRPQANTFEETLPEPVLVRQARARLQDAIVEDLYYRLQWNASNAFHQYFLYAEETIASNDEILWVLLRAEIFGFLGSSAIEKTDTHGLHEGDVIADSAVRWVEWLFNQEKFNKALQIAERLTNEDAILVQLGGEISSIHLQIWLGTLYIYTGDYDKADYDKAEGLLTHSVEQLEALPKESVHAKLLTSILARAYNSLGYLYSSQTRYYEAIAEFAKAIPRWEAVALVVQLATSLNDRAFVLGKVGQFHTAIPLARVGLRLREQLGPRAQVGLSINTLALIELAQYDFAGGLRDARRAVEIFSRLGSKRGLGLALIARADASRRNAHSPTNVQQGKSAELLELAARDATEAVQIFTAEVQESWRRPEALRELGKDYSEWARIRQKYPALVSPQELEQKHKYTIEELARLSEQAFQQAAELATSDKFAEVDILIDWALLYWYTELYLGAPSYEFAMTKLETRLLKRIENLIPQEFINPQFSTDRLPRLWSWVQAGYVHLIRGHLLFGYWHQAQTEEQLLSKAIEHYTLSLACHSYFSDYVFQEMRRALNNIYENIVLLTPQQKVKVYDAVNAAEEKLGIGKDKSYMSRFMEERFGPREIFTFLG